jgi:hypothetical protein
MAIALIIVPVVAVSLVTISLVTISLVTVPVGLIFPDSPIGLGIAIGRVVALAGSGLIQVALHPTEAELYRGSLQPAQIQVDATWLG